MWGHCFPRQGLNIDPFPLGSPAPLPVSTLRDLPSAFWFGFPMAVTGHKQVNSTHKTAAALRDISKWRQAHRWQENKLKIQVYKKHPIHINSEPHCTRPRGEGWAFRHHNRDSGWMWRASLGGVWGWWKAIRRATSLSWQKRRSVRQGENRTRKPRFYFDGWKEAGFTSL